MLDPEKCKPGSEQFEQYLNSIKANNTEEYIVTYDYCFPNGEIFSCTGKSLKQCRRQRDKWARSHGLQ